MNAQTLLFVIALIFALFAQWEAKGRSFLGWAVIAVCVGLLWGHPG